MLILIAELLIREKEKKDEKGKKSAGAGGGGAEWQVSSGPPGDVELESLSLLGVLQVIICATCLLYNSIHLDTLIFLS